MKKLIRHSLSRLTCALALGLQACGGDLPPAEDTAAPREAPAVEAQALPAAPADAPTDILVALQAIPGLTVVREAPPPAAGVRFFVLSYDQPVDHRHPEGARFQQRLTLVHRSTTAPTVLATTGYGISTSPYQTEPTYLLQGNQLLQEHRFFGPSTPQPTTWKHLTLEQAASDAHRVVQAFKPLYTGKWVNTGGSKGGMASVYHRVLYPNDVDATVAYVAPSSHGTQDPRYIQFLTKVGDATCRARIQAFQRDILTRREELAGPLSATASDYGVTFDFLGVDKVLEFTALELPFAFWQYSYAEECAYIPEPGASVEEVLSALEYFVNPYSFSDDDIYYYAPYYFQADTQLGSYRSDERPVRGLVRYPNQYKPSSMIPFSMDAYPFNPLAMPIIEAWVKLFGQRMLFIYGQNDPWSTNAFNVSRHNDSYRFFVPGGNHGSSISALPPADRTVALDKLRAWTGLPPQALEQVSLKAADVAAGRERVETLAFDRRRRPPRD